MNAVLDLPVVAGEIQQTLRRALRAHDVVADGSLLLALPLADRLAPADGLEAGPVVSAAAICSANPAASPRRARPSRCASRRARDRRQHAGKKAFPPAPRGRRTTPARPRGASSGCPPPAGRSPRPSPRPAPTLRAACASRRPSACARPAPESPRAWDRRDLVRLPVDLDLAENESRPGLERLHRMQRRLA